MSCVSHLLLFMFVLASLPLLLASLPLTIELIGNDLSALFGLWVVGQVINEPAHL